MDRSEWWSSYLGGTLVVLVPAVLVAGTFVWFTRRDRVQLRPIEFVVGYAVGLVVSVTATAVVEPRTSFGTAVCSMLAVVIATAIMLPWSWIRTRRWHRREAAGRAAARAAIPSAAREYFESDAFQRELDGISEAHVPSPATASDVITYWVFRALDSGEYVEWSRSIFHATAVKGWRVSTPTLSGTVPWLVAPYQASGDKRWDPAVDRDFREYGSATLIARFGMPVPA